MTLNTMQFSNRDRTLPGMPLPNATANRPAQAPEPPRWSGVDRQQMIMGVHDLAHTYEPDPHGFLHEPESGKATPGPSGPNVKHLPEADRSSGVAAKSFYGSHGGRHWAHDEVAAHWNSQPLHDIPSDTLIHTGQHWEHETEWGNDMFAGSNGEGRERIDKIKQDLNTGGSIQKPAWIMKHNDRLYALDGHHRIVASRESGKPTFPARVWDRDA